MAAKNPGGGRPSSNLNDYGTPTAITGGNTVNTSPTKQGRYDDVQAVTSRPMAEVFQTMSSNGTTGRVTYSYNMYQSMPTDMAKAWFSKQPAWLKEDMKRTAKAIDYRGSAQGLWDKCVEISRAEAAEGRFIAPEEVYSQFVGSGLWPDPSQYDGSDSSGGGGYSYGGGGYGGGGGGTSASVTLSNPEDARAVINDLAIQMIGRTVTDKEFKQYFQTLNKAERANPTISTLTVGPDGTPTQETTAGLGAEGRTAALQEAIRGNEGFNEYAIGSQAVSLMSRYLQERGVFGG